MKLVSFDVPCWTGSHQRVGVLDDGQIVDVAATAEALHERDDGDVFGPTATPAVATTMQEFLATGSRGIEAAERAVEALSSGAFAETDDERKLTYDRDQVGLRSPLRRPNSIRDCSVYEKHLCNCRDIEPGELPGAYYEYPHYYKGNPDAVVHPGDEVAWPAYTERFDFELEVAAVIGNRGRDIDPARAEDHIAGFTIFNDFSARNVQADTKPLKLGPAKSKDFANGFGPCLVTTDSIDPTDLRTEVRVNGEVWSENTTDGMTHSWGEILAYVSEGVTVHPGDVIGSGTVPRGCSLELGRWLEPGDRLALTVEGIGTLTHRIGEPA